MFLGGPHSVFNTSYLSLLSFYCIQGYAVLLVNFRGSIGYGEANVKSLPGKCGDQDVKDVQVMQYII
jgi:acylaminoacyl-peptidase